MSKKAEVVKQDPIEVINQDEFMKLDTKLQEKIIAITKELNLSSVALFNPLVKAIIDIDAFKVIKYVENKPETIQAYKDAKAFIKKFRASVKRTKSSIKKPMLDTGRELDSIEKIFITDATLVLEHLDKEFKPFLDAEQEKKDKAQAKRDKKKDDAIKELSQESVDNKLVIERMNVFNRINKQIGLYVSSATEQAKSYSKEALQEEFAILTNTKFEIPLADEVFLLSDQSEELKVAFHSAIKSAKLILNMKINEAPRSPSDHIESPETMMAPSISGTSPNYIRDSIAQAINNSIITIGNLHPALPKEEEGIRKVINGLTNYIETVNRFFEK